MDQVRLGNTGLFVSRLCLGMLSFGDPSILSWAMDAAAGAPIVKRAVDAGITFFDTADGYSHGASEVATGRLLSKLLPREQMVIATKVHTQMTPGPNGQGLSRKHIMDAIDASLRRLRMDYVDLYQVHRWDPSTPIEETMEALHDVIKAGKARYIGASSMYAWQFAKAQLAAERTGSTRFVSMQNHYNLLYREEEREMIPLCIDLGAGLLAWSPLARGLLAGTRTLSGERHTTRSRSDHLQDVLYDSPADFAIIDAVRATASRRGVSLAQLALAWLLHRPGVTAPIFGATKISHIDDAVAATELQLSDEELAELEGPYVAHPAFDWSRTIPTRPLPEVHSRV
jgi:1-deoxyxylulose-5-phosphate synthase